MSKFLQSEKEHQAQFKATSATFSEAAREDGYFATKFRPYCLPTDYAEENLFPEIRETARTHFEAHAIKWHQGMQGKPSNHMCDSQVCCVNFLFPFADKPEALATLLRPLYPDLQQMLPIENGFYVTHEWVGVANYLGEGKSPKSKPSRGALFTSTDAAVRFQRTDGTIQVVLIEWKYTESYSGGVGLAVGNSGQRRIKTYANHVRVLDWNSTLQWFSTVDALYETLFYEPFYQFMRQQLLAYYMEQAKELDAHTISLLHIAPAHNEAFRRITSPQLASLSQQTHSNISATDLWQQLAPLDRFKSVNTEILFGKLSTIQLPDMHAWLDYINQRYAWVREPL